MSGTERSEDDLLQEIGEALLFTPDGQLELRKNPRQFAEPGTIYNWTPLAFSVIAKQALARRYQQMHMALCGNAERRQKILGSDESAVAALVADALMPLAMGFPVLTLSTLIAKIGLRRFCGSNPFTDPASVAEARSEKPDGAGS
mgnify:CR=1 FL=1